MTIRDLCSKHEKCHNWPFSDVCPFTDFWDKPLNELNDKSNEEVTKSIIETAKLLQEDNNND